MTGTAPAFRIVALDCFERPVRYRLPFRFGAATVTSGVQAFVRARIRLADGREADGGTAELMVPKWFDKDPALSDAANVDQLRAALQVAREAYLDDARPRTAFDHAASRLETCRREGERRALPPLAAGFGPAEVDRAVIDALCRALGVPFDTAVRENLLGFAPAGVAPDLAALDGGRYLQGLAPAARVAVRHTVGLADALTGDPAQAADGLPESLEQAIARYGLRWFKLKLSGDVAFDADRLRAIAAVLAPLGGYRVTLDGNEQYGDVEPLLELIRRLRGDAAGARLVAAVAYLEQPLARARTFERDVARLARVVPRLIDEADAGLDSFVRARSLGYTGVSSKSCKGLYKSLVNAARCAAWNEAAGSPRYFVSAEDLTTPAGLALQQDVALAAQLGLAHVERNGYHYLDGAAGASRAEQQALHAAHPDLYDLDEGGLRVAIRDGGLTLASLRVPGFASSVLPDWASLSPLAVATESTASAA